MVNKIVNLNVVLGSVINSEKNYLYYLSHTSTLSNIPKYILDNVKPYFETESNIFPIL